MYVYVQVGDSVIGLHPAYSFSYAPATVLKLFPDLWASVRFYDGEEAQLPREEMFHIG